MISTSQNVPVCTCKYCSLPFLYRPVPPYTISCTVLYLFVPSCTTMYCFLYLLVPAYYTPLYLHIQFLYRFVPGLAGAQGLRGRGAQQKSRGRTSELSSQELFPYIVPERLEPECLHNTSNELTTRPRALFTFCT